MPLLLPLQGGCSGGAACYAVPLRGGVGTARLVVPGISWHLTRQRVAARMKEATVQHLGLNAGKTTQQLGCNIS